MSAFRNARLRYAQIFPAILFYVALRSAVFSEVFSSYVTEMLLSVMLRYFPVLSAMLRYVVFFLPE